MTRDKDDDYVVGYGKPPVASQFKPGQSGNPQGRKPGSRSLKAALKDELAATVEVRDGDGYRTMSRMDALTKRLIATALSGDRGFMVEALRQINLHLSETEGVDHADLPASEEDLRLLLEYIERHLRAEGAPDKEEDDGDQF